MVRKSLEETGKRICRERGKLDYRGIGGFIEKHSTMNNGDGDKESMVRVWDR